MPNPSAAMKPQADEAFVISRLLHAPRERVWQAWTDCAQLKHWWGPKGFTVSHCKLELKLGGFFHYALRNPNGEEMWGKFVFREIAAPERLGFINCFSDTKGGITRHPWNENWPLQTISVITFADRGGKTELAVRWTPHEATPIERKTFAENHASMQQGWTGTLDQLEAYLAKSG